jgi:hypothetical protein
MNNHNWHEAYALSSDVSLYDGTSQSNTPEFAFLMRSKFKAKEEIWKREEITFKPHKDHENKSIASIIKFFLIDDSSNIYFIGISRSIDGALEYLDQDILALMSEQKKNLKPLWKAENKKGKIIDVDTGLPGLTLEIRFIGWSNESTIKIKFDSDSGSSSCGYFATMKYFNDDWRVGEILTQWHSTSKEYLQQ